MRRPRGRQSRRAVRPRSPVGTGAAAPAGTADPGHHRSRGQRHRAQLEAGPVVRPQPPVGSLDGYQSAGVIDDRHVERLPGGPVVRTSSATRRRASAISDSLSPPCSASHSSTPARPLRATRARRAAFVMGAQITRSCRRSREVEARGRRLRSGGRQRSSASRRHSRSMRRSDRLA